MVKAAKGASVVSRRSMLICAACAVAAPHRILARVAHTIPAVPRTDRPLLFRGGTVLTMDPAGRTPAGADVLVTGGKIVRIASGIVSEGAEVIDASRAIVMPGFVDAHRHLWEGLLRDLLPTEDLAGYVALVNRRMGPAFAPDDAYLGTLVGALGALDAGVTTVLDWSHISSSPAHTDAVIAALHEGGGRAVFGYGKGLRDDLGAQWPNDLLSLKQRHFASADQLLTLGLATTSPEFVADDVAAAHFRLAREAGVLVSIHAGMSGIGTPGAIARFGRRGLLGPDVNLVHCNTLSAEEWRIIADTGTSVTITPTVEMQMGHGVPAIMPARAAGVQPSLGVDVETSAPADLWAQMRAIYALQRMQAFTARGIGQQVALMTPHDVLELATVAGARATLLDRKIGSLVAGKEADLIMVRTDLLNVMPVTGPESAVLLGMDARNIDTVLVAGRAVKRRGSLVGVDLEPLRAKLVEAAARVLRDAKVDPAQIR